MDDILKLASERFLEASRMDRRERQLADDDLRFAIDDEGCQWPQELRQIREGDNPPRPCLVLNKIPEKIDVVDGEFKQLRPGIKVRAVDNQADPPVAEVVAGLIRHIEYNSGAPAAYQTSHTSTLYCGRGAWRIDVGPAEEDPFVSDIKINRIPNVFTVYWDPHAKKEDKSDARYFFVTEVIPRREFERDHPDVIANWPTEGQWDEWKTEDGYRIAEYWWQEDSKKTFYRVERKVNGFATEMTVTEKQKGDKEKDVKSISWPRVKWAKLVAGYILEGPEDWPGRYIPIVVQIGKEVNVRGQSKTRGMVRFAKTPQQMYNFWSSATTELMTLAPKAPYLVTARMIDEYQGIWDAAGTRNFPYLPYNADPEAPGGRPLREPPPMMSSAYQAEFIRMERDIMSATGIYQAQLGDEGQEKSGRAIEARQRQGSIGSFPYTSSFQSALIHSARILIDLIPYVYDTERVVRILGPDGEEDTVPINARIDPYTQQPMMPGLPQVNEQYLGMPRPGITDYLNDLTVGKYDVTVSIGPSYTSQKEEFLAILMDLMGTVPQIGPMVMDLLVNALDMPHSEELIKRLKKLVPPEIRGLDEGEEPPQQQPDPRVMLEMAKLELEKARLTIDEFKAQAKAIADLITAEAKQAGEQRQAIAVWLEDLRASTQMSPAAPPEGGGPVPEGGGPVPDLTLGQ